MNHSLTTSFCQIGGLHIVAGGDLFGERQRILMLRSLSTTLAPAVVPLEPGPGSGSRGVADEGAVRVLRLTLVHSVR